MEDIQQAIVDRTRLEVQAYPPDRAAVKARRFLADRPHVARFVKTRIRAFGHETVGLVFTTGLVPVRRLEAARGTRLGAIPAARRDAATPASRDWLDPGDGMERRLLERSPDLLAPHLAPHRVALLATAQTGHAAHADEGSRPRFPLVEAILDSLD